MATLKITRGADAGKVVVLDGSPVSIGRDPASVLRLPDSDRKASRRHATVTGGPAFVITDMGSTCGTLLNGQRLTVPATLKNGDEVAIGETIIVFEQSPPAASETTLDDQLIALQEALYSDEVMALKTQVLDAILGRMGKKVADVGSGNDHQAQIEGDVGKVLDELSYKLPKAIPTAVLRQAILDEFLAYGPISPFLRKSDLEEVMVNGPNRVFVACRGKIIETKARFLNDEHLMRVIRRIVGAVGKHIDQASPTVDARLPDGSRVNAVVPPLALDGPSLTIRKFSDRKLAAEDLIVYGSMTRDMAQFLQEAVRVRQNVLVSGGTGSGKTTLLNVLSQFIPLGERLVTIEDTAELRLNHPNLVRLETRPPNIEGRGAVSIRDLVVNALRMRPDRIIVGECRGPEAFDMLQAMNTGHDGSLTTIHANGTRDALLRLENMVMMAVDLPSHVIREQITSAINLVVQQARLSDGTRKVTFISEVTGREKDVILMQDIFRYERTGFDEKGRIVGRYLATGNRPRFIDELRDMGDLRVDLSIFRPPA